MSYRLKLKEMRKASGLTQKEVAERADVKLATYRTWEQGVSGISLEKAYALAMVLGCSVNDLCGWPKGKNEGREFEDDFEAELLRYYRASTPDRQDMILDTARDAAGMSKKWPNVICLKPSSRRHRRR
jgi:transcriptional regulator with XRE-family HTH domain